MKRNITNLFIILFLMIGVNAMAQQKIRLRSTEDYSKCEKSDMKGFTAKFSFSTLEAQDYKSKEGEFSWLSLPNTVIGGNEGDPQIPVVNELIAVPFGAKPSIRVQAIQLQITILKITEFTNWCLVNLTSGKTRDPKMCLSFTTRLPTSQPVACVALLMPLSA